MDTGRLTYKFRGAKMSDRELLEQAVEALIRADKISGYANNKAVITTAKQALGEA